MLLQLSAANKDLLGNAFWNRTDLDVLGEVKTSSRNLVYNGYARWSAGFYNFRHMMLVGSSAAGARTLS